MGLVPHKLMFVLVKTSEILMLGLVKHEAGCV